MAYNGELSDVLFSPGDIITLARGEVEEIRKEGKGLYFGVPALDYVWNMNKRGKVIGLYADTSHGKSAFAKFACRNFIPQLVDDEIGIFWTNEDSVESVAVSDLSNISGVASSRIYSGDMTEEDQQSIRGAEVRRLAMPLWIVGHSNQKRTINPRLSVYDFLEMMEYVIEKQNKNVRFVWLDYLQLLNLRGAPSDASTRREKLDDAMTKLRDLALGYGVTVFVNTQTGRHLKERKWKIPQLGDAKETSGFEEALDGGLSMWFVHRDVPVNTPIDAEGEMLVVSKELVLMQALKQKHGATRDIFALDFVPEYGEYVPYQEAEAYRQKRAQNG